MYNYINTNEQEIKLSDVKIYRLIKKNSFVLLPGQHKTISKKCIFLKKQLQKSGSYYIFDQNKHYTFQVVIEYDSTRIKKYLLSNDLDSLRRNNIKIFHGKLETEKIPLIIK